MHENKFSERPLRSVYFTNQIQNQNKAFNLLMSQWNCNNFSSLETIATRKKKNDESYQWNDHDRGVKSLEG